MKSPAFLENICTYNFFSMIFNNTKEMSFYDIFIPIYKKGLEYFQSLQSVIRNSLEQNVSTTVFECELRLPPVSWGNVLGDASVFEWGRHAQNPKQVNKIN